MQLCRARVATRMVDYSRWDNIDDDEDDEVPNLRADYTRKAAHHQASMQLIAEQLKQVWVLTEEQTAHLLDFLAVQHRGVYEDNLRRATEIVAFIEARQAPSTRPLHALAYRASQTAKESDDQQQVSQAKKVCLLVQPAAAVARCPQTSECTCACGRFSTLPWAHSTRWPPARPPVALAACSTRCTGSRRGRRRGDTAR